MTERRVMKKFSTTKQNLHKKFISRLMRLDFPRQAYITRLLDVIYFTKRNPKHSYHVPWTSGFSPYREDLETILDNLHAEIGGLCAYQAYVPEIIERQNDNFMIYEFLTLSSAQAKIIISITEYLVKLYIEGGVKNNVWESVVLEFEEVEQTVSKTQIES